MSESSVALIVALAQLVISITGSVGIFFVLQYRVGQIERERREEKLAAERKEILEREDRDRREDRERQEREKVFGHLGEALSAIQKTFAEKSVEAAEEHSEFRNGLAGVRARLDDHRGRFDDHSRRFDGLENRTTRLESGGRGSP